jgi:hypothetical protein
MLLTGPFDLGHPVIAPGAQPVRPDVGFEVQVMKFIGYGGLDGVFQAGSSSVIPNAVFEIHGKQPRYCQVN